MNNIFHFDFKVRGYELDSFGHANNAVYINWLEQARWEIIEQLGLNKQFETDGMFLIVVETNIKYVRELKLFDKAQVETKMYHHGFFLDFHQRIYNADKQTSAKATVKCLFVDTDRKPLDIPDIVRPYLHDTD